MTNSMHVIIAAENDPNGVIADEVERRLLEALRQNVPASRWEGTHVGCPRPPGSHDWWPNRVDVLWLLLVKMLWVAEQCRGHGLGARLMVEAETIARSSGCHGAWLDTSSAGTEQFYIRLGYEPFGVPTNGFGEKPQGIAVPFSPNV
jgi:GNAT superfamily N-acetyltransferase